MAATMRKRGSKVFNQESKENDIPHLQQKDQLRDKLADFDIEAPVDSESDSDDSTDSEESVYSGLEEEPSDSDDIGSDEEDNSSEGDDSRELDKSDIKQVNEYEYDSSDEEDIRNTVGNIPLEWYQEYKHIGYDLSGKKILKPNTGDELDNLIEQSENPDYWRTVKDPQTGQNVVLSREDTEIIERIKSGKYADGDVNPYEEWSDWFTRDVEIHPLIGKPEDKRSFIPSRWERLKVGKMVHSMKMGWMKPRSERVKEDKAVEKYFDVWTDEEEANRARLKMHIPAPKTTLPGHSESYNPPPEYLFNKEELEKWKETDPEDRRQNFIPQKYTSMRLIPAYSRFINERFERCLDLYLCPRQQKMRMNVNPEDLIPKLPQPKDLQPFPTTQAILFKGHTDLVRKISVDPTGQWFVSGSDDMTAKFWEIQTGRCLTTLTFDDKVKCVSWNPNPSLSLVSLAVGNDVYIINPQLGDKLVSSHTDNHLNEAEAATGASETINSAAKWTVYNDEESDEFQHMYRLKVTHSKVVSQLTWHTKGDYFAVTLSDAGNQSVIIHQMTKRRSQCPFSKPKGLVQCTLFHPTKPYLFVATQRYIRVYNLLKQELTKKLQANCKWISSMAIHPGGDNVITGSYDSRLHWFDMDLSAKPYQTLKHQKKAIRNVDFHKKYPLFASASDDGSVVVCHGMVYNDLMQNPLIVPVKVLKGHTTVSSLSAIDCQFHPTQPWILTSGADSTIRLYS